MKFNEALKNRRSIYGLSKNINHSDNQIKGIVEEAVLHVPSAFNSQSTRTAVLFGEHHDRLWSIVEENLRKILSEEVFPETKNRIDLFKNAYGTVLFFEDNKVVKNLQEQFPLYKENFPTWAKHENGMLQFAIWTSLETEGMGASIQHYNPLIDKDVKSQWEIPDSWQLIAQMPFGAITEKPGKKEFMPLEQRVKVFK